MTIGKDLGAWVLLPVAMVLAGCDEGSTTPSRKYPLAEGTPIGYWESIEQASHRTILGGTAVTDREYVIWGGTTGALGIGLDLETLTWRVGVTGNRPGIELRNLPLGVWTGKEIIFWGGYGCKDESENEVQCDDGAIADPETREWRPMSNRGAPDPPRMAQVGWTGEELILWGGAQFNPDPGAIETPETFGNGAIYNYLTDTWRPISSKGAPSPRRYAISRWTGEEFVVWGGETRDSDGDQVLLGDGAVYNPETDSWRPIASEDAPAPNAGAAAAWTGRELLIWGSRFGDAMKAYDPVKDRWRPMDPRGPHWVEGSGSTWTGKYLVVFGDRPEEPGALYDPEKDSWTPMGMEGSKGYTFWAVGFSWKGDVYLFGPEGIGPMQEGMRFVIPDE